MGGSGSGNHYHWWRGSKKDTVEDCLTLDAKRWSREGILRAGSDRIGSWTWTYASGNTFSVNYAVDALDLTLPTVRLSYAWARNATKQAGSEAYTVRLTTTRPHFGGLRWWFICPLVVSGRPCNRRVGKLYLPGHGRFFGCRHCHDLTYTSCQESGRFDRLYQHIAASTGYDVATVKRVINRKGIRNP